MANLSLTPYRSATPDLYRGRDPFWSLHRQINRMFDDVLGDFADTREMLPGVLAPRVDVSEDDKETRITAELPGVSEEDINLSVDSDVVTIRAEKRIERSQDGKRHVTERAYGMFERALRLAHPVDPDQVHAHFDRGVLTVTLPHSAEAERGHRIRIESGPTPAGKQTDASESRH
ncbi:Hsp20/alpha crystallin family protein [Sphingomonas oligophenolica]|uniref:Hsp20/alpha crystallin family protein n=1 Tax=Sphingomonas oligophenolica TaxID=301154 RepID=A0ABU9XYL3_9SPHN